MDIPYPRPGGLSDPYYDWHGSEEEIQKVVSTDPEKLGRDAFWMIFSQNLPAANYEEGCYYVPYFLQSYSRTPDFQSPGLEGFFWFIDHFRADFERDGLLDQILDRVWQIFRSETSSFRVHRLTDQELAEHGICESYREMAPRSPIVHEMLDCFTDWVTYDPILKLLKEHFSEVSSDENSFWYCECAFHTRTWLWVDSEPVGRRQDLFDYFHRLDRFSRHFQNSFLNMSGKISEGYIQFNRRLSPT